ncbi:hypothetical protein IKF94_03105 [Candidatus Saccharibacteria bacterium]|nr:hypothetical protein [Candidatus Saccharibacteria bacterium]
MPRPVVSCHSNLLHLFPFSLPYGGFVTRTTGAFGSRGSYGYFWASGANSGVNARYLVFVGAGVWPEYNNYKTLGFSVRCLAQ